MVPPDVETIAQQFEKNMASVHHLFEGFTKKNEDTLITLASIKVELRSISDNVSKLSRVVIDGNGSSLVTRMTVIEGREQDVEIRLAKVESSSQTGAVTDALTDFKVKVLWGGIGALMLMLAGAMVKLYL